MGPWVGRVGVQVALVLLVCVAVYWVGLGRSGFVASEGHRVVPAWSMLDTGDALVPRLFERTYLRKPPGMFWAIAISSEILGRSEFAARAVSAAAMTAGALLSLAFARRWFGHMDPKAGLVAGLGHALSPWFWQIGRVAEIESLHQLGAQASVLLLIDLALGPARLRWQTIVMSAGAGMSMAAMVLVKGPAGLPCLVGTIAGSCVVARSAARVFGPSIRWAFLAAASVLAVVFGAILSAVARSSDGAVAQSISEFLWAPERAADVFLMVPTALGSALPLSLALLYPWSRSLDAAAMTTRVARALAWTCILSLAIYFVAGVTNRRYVLPSFAFLAPLGAFAAARIASGAMVGVPWRVGHAILLDRPWVWFIGSAAYAGVWLGVIEPRRSVHGGRAPGEAIAASIAAQPGEAPEVWADDMVEARPDILEYASIALRERGRPARIRWVPIASVPEFPRPGDYLVLRTDAESDELRLFTAAGLASRATLIQSGTARQYSFGVYRVNGP